MIRSWINQWWVNLWWVNLWLVLWLLNFWKGVLNRVPWNIKIGRACAWANFTRLITIHPHITSAKSVCPASEVSLRGALLLWGLVLALLYCLQKVLIVLYRQWKSRISSNICGSASSHR